MTRWAYSEYPNCIPVAEKGARTFKAGETLARPSGVVWETWQYLNACRKKNSKGEQSIRERLDLGLEENRKGRECQSCLKRTLCALILKSIWWGKLCHVKTSMKPSPSMKTGLCLTPLLSFLTPAQLTNSSRHPKWLWFWFLSLLTWLHFLEC